MYDTIRQAQIFERMFPTYIGSMTAWIEKCFRGVYLRSSILTQRPEPLEGFLADMTTTHGFKRGANVIHRRAILYDEKTEEKFLFASSLLNKDVLPLSAIRNVYEKPEEPLGRYLKEIPIEKTILFTTNRPCGPFLAEQFSRDESEPCHVRRILFSVENQPAILIEEVFPCRCYQDCPLLAVCERAS
jgi:chorismate-pyruvate lyase